jgi:hypothetical protein
MNPITSSTEVVVNVVCVALVLHLAGGILEFSQQQASHTGWQLMHRREGMIRQRWEYLICVCMIVVHVCETQHFPVVLALARHDCLWLLDFKVPIHNEQEPLVTFCQSYQHDKSQAVPSQIFWWW